MPARRASRSARATSSAVRSVTASSRRGVGWRDNLLAATSATVVRSGPEYPVLQRLRAEEGRSSREGR